MKVYQEQWLEKITRGGLSDLLDTCAEINADDTGATDPLTQALAKRIISLLSSSVRPANRD